MSNPALAQDRPERTPALHDQFPRFGIELMEVNHDGPELDRPALRTGRQDHLPPHFRIVLLNQQHLQLDGMAVEALQRGGHVRFVNQQRSARLGHLVRRHNLDLRERCALAPVKRAERSQQLRFPSRRPGHVKLRSHQRADPRTTSWMPAPALRRRHAGTNQAP
jgi:hypothetical protein